LTFGLWLYLQGPTPILYSSIFILFSKEKMMNLQQLVSGEFDVAQAIRFLALRVHALEAGQAAATMVSGAPSATMVAGTSTPGIAVVKVPLVAPTDALDALLNDRVARALRAAGLDTVEAVAAATDEALLAINGIGPNTLREIRQVIPFGG
jgi:hypothetical protein